MYRIFYIYNFFLITISLTTKSDKDLATCFLDCQQNKQNDLLTQFGCYQQCQLNHKGQQQKAKLEFFEQKFSSLPDNYCLGGQEPHNYKDRLRLFAQGPCSPLILAPGTMGTKLRVEIDCETLKNQNPEQFKTCGWTHCSKHFYEFWKSVPNKEYKLWINDLLSNVNFFGSLKSNLCFVGFFKSSYNFSVSPQNWIRKSTGYKVKISGFTPETKNENKCGANAIQDLLPLPFQIKASRDYQYVIQEIERIGYTTGLTYQAMPYNFYNSLFQNEFTLNFKKQVQRLYKLTGKKISIVAHSNGNLLTLYNLHMFFDQNEKEKYFRNFVSLGAPFLGAYQASRYLLAGDSDLTALNGMLGLKWKASQIFMNHQSGLYFFLTKDYRKLYQNESWFQKIEQRLKYEKDNSIPYDQSGINFWPSKDQVCYKENETDYPKQCLLDFEDPTEEFIQIGDEKFGSSNFSEALNKHNPHPVVNSLYSRISQTNVGLINPGIPTFLVYESIEKTDFKVNFHKFDEQVKSDQYPTFDHVSYTRGDGTVQSSSTLLPGLRWALKSDEGDSSYKKVTFVELCSQVNKDTELFDGKADDGSKIFTKNKYMGIDCDCSTKNNYKDCVHASTISDVIDVGEKATPEQMNYIEQMEEEYLRSQVEDCNHYEVDIYKSPVQYNQIEKPIKRVKKRLLQS